MWPFGRVKREDIEELHDRLDEINHKLERLGGGSVDDTPDFDIEKLPNDPAKLQRIMVARQLKRKIAKQEMMVGHPGYKRRQPDLDENDGDIETPAGSITDMAQGVWKGLNPVVRMGISKLAGKYGINIDEILQNEQVLGAVVQGVGGMAIGKLQEFIKKPDNGQLGGQGGLNAPAGLVLAPYPPNIGPQTRNQSQ